MLKKYSKTNSKYLKSHDPNKQSKYITYVDEKNLYDPALSKYLPYGGFKWLNQKEIDRFDVNSINEDSSDKYILEVDLEYVDELHDLYNDYPLAPENPEIIYDMLSDYCKIITDKYGIKVVGVKKLLLNL